MSLRRRVERLRSRLYNEELELREQEAHARQRRLVRVNRAGRSVLMEWQTLAGDPRGRLIPAAGRRTER